MTNIVNGFILINKAKDISSAHVVAKMKYLFNAKKCGHTGTLDPSAEGLLPICFGEATKFASFLLEGKKEYIASIQLGITTDSYDLTGTIIAKSIVNINLSDIKSTLDKFKGESKQLPPIYSALKHNGKPLYQYVRTNKNVSNNNPDLITQTTLLKDDQAQYESQTVLQNIAITEILQSKIRYVTIYELELMSYCNNTNLLTLRVLCSKGTYIRTLAEDIGNLLGCGASLIALRRTKTNKFQIQEAITLDDLAANGLDTPRLLAVDVLTEELPSYELNDAEFSAVKFGNIAPSLQNEYPLNQDYRLYFKQYFLGVGYFNVIENQNFLHPKRLISNLSTLLV